ncbi:iron-containing alcohol dehydrogenase [Caldisphaera sp.]|uniref:iron-containing alcohol dehydrogenase n=1 Tax=Caldisphaera sp. TaxID=2060322 RepID=UPI0025C66202|nr:iron-containing alcohol dehydrogenase [Caldisphaera sp.]
MVSLVLPRKIIYNADSLEELLNLSRSYGLKNILIITDKVIRSTDYFKKIEEGLAKNGINVRLYYDISPEPNIETVNNIYEFIKGENIDLIVAIGGGSVIDVSKVLRVKLLRPDLKSEDISPFVSLNLENKFPLLVTIPTTAGTGSDASFAFVLKIKENNYEIKYASGNYDLVPYESILDINFLKTLPKKQLIITAIDGLANDIEGIVSINSNPLSEGIAIQSARMFFKYLPKVVENKDDEESLNYLHLAATLSGIAFSNSGVGLVHAIAHPLGSLFNIPHGMAVAIVMPYVINFNYKDKNAGKMYDEIKIALEQLDGFEIKKNLTEHLIDLYNKIGQPKKLSEIAIDEKTYKSSIDKIADLALRDPDLAFNPISPTIDEIKDILNKIY